MISLVTGAAGFIGSHLAEELIRKGGQVVGVDSFTDYYSRGIKENNLEYLREQEGFTFIEGDLLDLDLEKLLAGIDYCFHQAAQAGVRASWGKYFDTYTRCNILATQRLLEAAKESRLKKFVFASSSSVYGDNQDMPLREDSLPRPLSPYGVTKLAAENLVSLYYKNYGLPTVSLRYFTVFGPRQRPDMAFHKFIKAIFKDEEIFIYGDGEQTRDFTFISDIVHANILAAESELSGEIFNIGGGSRISLKGTIKILEENIGRQAKLRCVESQRGDMRHTWADISRVKDLLGYKPDVDLSQGLVQEIEWLKSLPDTT
ncbi:MAG: NAD-dependent epimerase/dehydratase family protein [bacterium]|nr:NAD-dependent epimerase/dehydratase family protein [bacterium]